MTATSPTRKDTAEFLRLALLAGACKLPAIVRWADSVIVSEPSPPFAFFDLSTCETQPVSTAVGLLSEVPGQSTPDLPVQMLLGLCYHLVRCGTLDAPGILLRLYHLSKVEQFPERVWLDLLTFEDGLSLARDQVYGTPADVARVFTDYLSRFETYAPEIPAGNG